MYALIYSSVCVCVCVHIKRQLVVNINIVFCTTQYLCIYLASFIAEKLNKLIGLFCLQYDEIEQIE